MLSLIFGFRGFLNHMFQYYLIFIRRQDLDAHFKKEKPTDLFLYCLHRMLICLWQKQCLCMFRYMPLHLIQSQGKYQTVWTRWISEGNRYSFLELVWQIHEVHRVQIKFLFKSNNIFEFPSFEKLI